MTIYLLIVHSCCPFGPSSRLSSTPHHFALLHPRLVISSRSTGVTASPANPADPNSARSHTCRARSRSATPTNLSRTLRESLPRPVPGKQSATTIGLIRVDVTLSSEFRPNFAGFYHQGWGGGWGRTRCCATGVVLLLPLQKHVRSNFWVVN